MQTSVSLSASRTSHETLLSSIPGRIVLAVAASAFVAACAHLSVPLWFTPVPLTLSDFAVLLVGLALGPIDGFAALALYLLEGAAGLPVFSPHGPGGMAQLFGATGGYLFAYPFAAACAGAIVRVLRGASWRYAAAASACFAATLIILAAGAVWLSHLAHLSISRALALGVVPFLPGQAIKIASAAGIFTTLNRLRRR
jgi:biotin transport system substrate-specific component